MKNDSRVPGPRKADKSAQKGYFHVFFVLNLNMHKHDDVFIN